MKKIDIARKDILEFYGESYGHEANAGLLEQTAIELTIWRDVIAPYGKQTMRDFHEFNQIAESVRLFDRVTGK